MSTIELPAAPAARRPVWRHYKRYLQAILILFRRRRRRILAHIELSRLDEELLCDLGIDPLDISAAIRDRHCRSKLPALARRCIDQS